MCYAVDVCNCFSSLSIENTPVMESDVDVIPTANYCWQVTESSAPSLVREAVTTPNNLNSDVTVNEAAIELSLCEREQLAPSCVGNLSRFAALSDVDHA